MARQVQRLTNRSVVTADRVRALHEGLVATGYRPRLPRSRSATPPPYLSYVAPSGQNLGYLRSQSFAVVRRDLFETLLVHPEAARSGPHVLLPLGDDSVVGLLLEVARDHAG